MGFQFNHSIGLKYKEEKGFYMRFTLDILNLDEEKREILAKNYVKSWMLRELEGNLQKMMERLATDPPTASEFENYKFHEFKNGNKEE